MSVVNWGLLAKSQIDPEKIEDAIARLISEHNDDPEAHLAEGQSLQSHKASEIIDHLVESIVEDKLANWCVTPLKFGTLIYSTIFESLDGFQKTAGVVFGADYDEVKLITFAVADNEQSLFKAIGHMPVYWDWGRDRNFETSIRMNNVASVYALALVGGAYHFPHIGFKIEDGKMYGTVGNNVAETTVELQDVANETKYHIEAIYFAGVKCEFYVNGVLRGTIESGLPSGNFYADAVIGVLVRTKIDSIRNIRLSYWDLRQKTE